MQVAAYDYELPDSSIAQEAIEPRDASRLLDTKTMRDLTFQDFPSLLRPDDLLIVNETKVRAARLIGTRHTGGRTEVLLTRRIDHERWQALLRPSKKLSSGSAVEIGDLTVTLLSDPQQGIATVNLKSVDGKDIEEAISNAGELPLPPYFHGELDDAERYQTMFARTIGSAAAPTAALHFTDRVVRDLTLMGVRIATVDLEVGIDTFRPMSDGDIGDHAIHTERVAIPPETAAAVSATRAAGGRVIAVGTTVVRSLETAATGDRLVSDFRGDSDLFIMPGYSMRVVDAMLTNFHAPRTTLLVLISAVLGDRWREVYRHAIESGYRFLSFGDAMFIEVER